MDKEIGMMARRLDEEKTVFERMKLERDQIKRIAGALTLYAGMLLLFEMLL